MKKVLKITGIVVLVLIILLVSTPFLFKDTIAKQVKKAINENVNAKVEWTDLSLSLISSFPDARLKLENVSVINEAPFEGDTLLFSKSIFLDMGIMQFITGGDEPMSINELGLDHALVNIKVNKKGQANYDIAKESPEDKTADNAASDEGISLDIKHYEIKDSRINYLDEQSKMFLRLAHLNHEGTGDFSAETSTLHTTTEALVSFAMDSTNYLDENRLKLTADIKMDLKNNKFTFEKNEAVINRLPLTFDGYVKINDNNQKLDISFKTPSSDFKNFLALIPKKYSGSLDKVKTSGDFSVNGRIYGIVDDEHIPKLNIAMKSDNASFKYADLPKTVKNITIDAVLKDETGLMKDLNLDLKALKFQIDQDVFSAKGTLKDLAGNTRVDLTANGTLNLANLSQAYPIETDLDLNGILKANLHTSFAMDAIEKERYQDIKSSGSASITDFNYNSDELAHPIAISKASLSFDPGNVRLNQFDLTTGQTDVHLTGKLHNLMGYLFKDQPIKGNFTATSNTFSVNDFMVPGTDKPQKESETKSVKAVKKSAEDAIKIPSFLDVALDFKADKVLYDNLTLANVKGTLIIQNEKATLKNVTAGIFGGTIGLDGSVSTKSEVPKFNMALSLNKINIVQSFQQMDLLKNLAPIAKALTGKVSTSITMSGKLTDELTPVYSSLDGKGNAKILHAEVEKNKMPLVSDLNSKLDFINFDQLKLNDLAAHFTFKNGAINIKPFDFKLFKDITAQVGGSHSFQNKMDYTVDLTLPAKYLGNEISGGLAQLTNSDLAETKVDIPISLTGNFSQPKINVNIKSAVQELTQRIIDEQKNELKNKAKDKLSELLGTGKDKGQKKDSTGTKKSDKEKVKDAAENVLKGLFNKGKKDKKDGNK